MRIRSKIALATVAAIGLAAPLTAGVGAAHADSDAAYVIGSVTDNAGQPLSDVSVDAVYCKTAANGSNTTAGANGCYGTSGSVGANTDRNGRYVIDIDKYRYLQGAPYTTIPGHWLVQADAPWPYADVPAQAVGAVAAGQNVTGPNFALTVDPSNTLGTPPTSGIVITGTATTDTGAPATYGYVIALDATTGESVGGSDVYGDGHYYITGVTGQVKLEFYKNGYLPTYSGGGLGPNKATVIAVPAAGQAPAVVNGTVLSEGTIAGTVRLPAAGAAWEASVTLYDLDGNPAGYGQTDAAGAFSIDVLPGTYYVRADGDRYTEHAAPSTCANCVEQTSQYDFVAGYYGKRATSLATAKKVTVSARSTRSVGTITLTNAYKNLEKPVIKAKRGVKKGAKLKVNSGTWNHMAYTTYTYTWKVGKKTIGTKSSLKLTKKIWKKKLKNGKKAKKLTVTVTASDRFGNLVDGHKKLKVLKTLAKQAKAKKHQKKK